MAQKQKPLESTSSEVTKTITNPPTKKLEQLLHIETAISYEFSLAAPISF